MARTLVTGGAGFIGANLLPMLLARGDEVRVLDSLVTGDAKRLGDDVELLSSEEAMTR